MPTPTPWGASDYLAAMKALLPRGRVWPRDVASILSKTLTGLVPVYARTDAAACALVGDAYPATTVALLPEWESSLGLPDPCAGQYATIPQRQAAVVAKLAGRGGQSVAYFVTLAANLGYPITIKQFAPAKFGQAKFGQPMLDGQWAHVWQVNAPIGAIRSAHYGQSRFGDAYRTWSLPVLECQVREAAPAHTVVIFDYSTSAGKLGSFILGTSTLG